MTYLKAGIILYSHGMFIKNTCQNTWADLFRCCVYHDLNNTFLIERVNFQVNMFIGTTYDIFWNISILINTQVIILILLMT